MQRAASERDGVPEASGGGGGGAAQGFAPADPKYESIAAIGRGGMGEVILANDRDLRRDVAMKVIRGDLASDPGMRRRFVAEAQATSQLEHPAIPPVYEIGLTPAGAIYFTMRVVRGKTLAEVVRDLVLGVREVRQEYTLHRLVTVIERVAEAVHFAHEKGVVHRDLKPENVMLGEFGEVSVMDWGIAKVVTTTADEEQGTTSDGVSTCATDGGLMTQVGAVTGTVPYMSPEQARGDEVDRRSDVYALGGMLYEVC